MYILAIVYLFELSLSFAKFAIGVFIFLLIDLKFPKKGNYNYFLLHEMW